MMVPSLQRVKSIVDHDVSSLLLDSAVRVVFRSFHDITLAYNSLATTDEGKRKKIVATCDEGHPIKSFNKLLVRSSENNKEYPERECNHCEAAIKHKRGEIYYTCG